MDYKRRQFIKSAAGLPLLFSSVPGIQSFAAKRCPKRFIAIFTPSGQYAPYWFPNYELNLQKKIGEVDVYPLKNFTPEISPVLGPWMNPYKDKMNLVRGLDIISLEVRDHWPAKMTSGHGVQAVRNETLDQVIAYSGKVYDFVPGMNSLELKVPGKTGFDIPGATISCRRIGDSVSPVFPVTDPEESLSRLFRKSVLNTEVLNKLLFSIRERIDHSGFSLMEKQRLELYMSLLHDANQKVDAVENIPDLGLSTATRSEYTLSFNKVIEQAIKLDLCRVFAFSLGEAAESTVFKEISGHGAHMNFHEMTHSGMGHIYEGVLKDIWIWQSKMVADLLARLDTVEDPETGATYLDNTLIYWGSSTSTKRDIVGNDNNHRSFDMCCALFGTAGGVLKSGQFIDYMSAEPRRSGRRVFELPKGGR